MSQTTQQQGAAPTEPKPRKDWEWFWRIIAALMLIVIGWVAWVMYQITPRSVVTPLVYESEAGRNDARRPEAGTTQPISSAPAAPQPTPEARAAAVLIEQTQTAMRSGAHQASADVQAAAQEKESGAAHGERLKLSTEITTPLVERTPAPRPQDARPDAASPAPAAKDQAGRSRP